MFISFWLLFYFSAAATLEMNDILKELSWPLKLKILNEIIDPDNHSKQKMAHVKAVFPFVKTPLDSKGSRTKSGHRVLESGPLKPTPPGLPTQTSPERRVGIQLLKAKKRVNAEDQIPRTERRNAKEQLSRAERRGNAEEKLPRAEKTVKAEEQISRADTKENVEEQVPSAERKVDAEEQLPRAEKRRNSEKQLSRDEKTVNAEEQLPSAEKRGNAEEDIPSAERIMNAEEQLLSAEKRGNAKEEIPRANRRVNTEEEQLPKAERRVSAEEDVPRAERGMNTEEEQLPKAERTVSAEEEIPRAESGMNTEEEQLPRAERRGNAEEENDENDMRLKLFRLMYETVRDSDLKVKRAELIKNHYTNSSSFEIGYLVGDITDKSNIITDISMTLKRFHKEWKPIEHINAYEQIANQAIEITHLIDLVRVVNKRDSE